jgi:hypothetical protein
MDIISIGVKAPFLIASTSASLAKYDLSCIKPSLEAYLEVSTKPSIELLSTKLSFERSFDPYLDDSPTLL